MSSIKKPEEFRRLYRKGKRTFGRTLVLYHEPNGLSRHRLGITVSKKNGNSVTRHRFVRLVREVFRLEQEKFAKGFDFCVVMKREIRVERSKQLTYHEIAEELQGLLRRNKDILI